jgi:hypothetical protein
LCIQINPDAFLFLDAAFKNSPDTRYLPICNVLHNTLRRLHGLRGGKNLAYRQAWATAYAVSLWQLGLQRVDIKVAHDTNEDRVAAAIAEVRVTRPHRSESSVRP